MDFYRQAGPMALGSRVRALAELITLDAAAIYKLYGAELSPKWFPVFYVLGEGKAQTVTTLAKSINHSHVSVSRILGEMTKAKLVGEKSDPVDGRRTLVALSPTGRAIARQMKTQYQDVKTAIDDVAKESRHDLWKALGEWETLLAQKSLLKRVAEIKQRRETPHIQIVDYAPKYHAAFRDLNREWITKYFKLEPPDLEALDHPDDYILKRGGHIFVALLDKKPVGVCALIKMKGQTYELAKMAVSPVAQGQNLGWRLGQAVIEKARELKAKRIYLESNTKLKPAISLYRKLGFETVKGPPTPYARCNIQMELKLAVQT